jgi:hypothetical protein
MSDTIQKLQYETSRDYLNRQPCVIALRKSNLPLIIKSEAEQFINRNILLDCGRVPPNCLKAFLINTAKKMCLSKIIPDIKQLFRSQIGYYGYYLDNGNLRHIDMLYNSMQSR